MSKWSIFLNNKQYCTTERGYSFRPCDIGCPCDKCQHDKSLNEEFEATERYIDETLYCTCCGHKLRKSEKGECSECKALHRYNNNDNGKIIKVENVKSNTTDRVGDLLLLATYYSPEVDNFGDYPMYGLNIFFQPKDGKVEYIKSLILNCKEVDSILDSTGSVTVRDLGYILSTLGSNLTIMCLGEYPSLVVKSNEEKTNLRCMGYCFESLYKEDFNEDYIINDAIRMALNNLYLRKSLPIYWLPEDAKTLLCTHQ